MIVTNDQITNATLSSFDADAQAFFNAADITDSIQQFAVDSFVKSLKQQNLWEEFYAIYPFVGGNAISHKYNLINPADSDSAFRLTFVNGPTHSVKGIEFNGTNQYMNTHLIPDTSFGSLGDFSIGYYTVVQPFADVSAQYGASVNTYNQVIQCLIADSLVVVDNWGEDVRLISTSGPFTFKGLVWSNSGSYSSLKNRLYINDMALITNNGTSTKTTTPVTIPLYFAARNNNGNADHFSKMNIQLAFIGKNLASKASEFNLIVQTLMSNLNRNA